MNFLLKKMLPLFLVIAACSMNACSAETFAALKYGESNHYVVIEKERMSAVENFLGNLISYTNPWVQGSFYNDTVQGNSDKVDSTVLSYASQHKLLIPETEKFYQEIVTIFKIIVSKTGQTLSSKYLGKCWDTYFEFEIGDGNNALISALKSLLDAESLVSEQKLKNFLFGMKNVDIDRNIVSDDHYELIEVS